MWLKMLKEMEACKSSPKKDFFSQEEHKMIQKFNYFTV